MRWRLSRRHVGTGQLRRSQTRHAPRTYTPRPRRRGQSVVVPAQNRGIRGVCVCVPGESPRGVPGPKRGSPFSVSTVSIIRPHTRARTRERFLCHAVDTYVIRIARAACIRYVSGVCRFMWRGEVSGAYHVPPTLPRREDCSPFLHAKRARKQRSCDGGRAADKAGAERRSARQVRSLCGLNRHRPQHRDARIEERRLHRRLQ